VQPCAVVNRPAALLCAVLRIVPGAWIARTPTPTPKFEPRFLRRRGEPAHGPVRRQLAHHARNTDVLGAGQKIEGHIMNGRTISDFGARGPRRWCHASVIPCSAIDRKTNRPPWTSVCSSGAERTKVRVPLVGSEVVSALSEGDDGGQSNPQGSKPRCRLCGKPIIWSSRCYTCATGLPRLLTSQTESPDLSRASAVQTATEPGAPE